MELQYDPLAGFKKTRLPNGLVVHAKHDSRATGVHVGFIIHAGAGKDDGFAPGTAHFTEHMVSQNVSCKGKRVSFKKVEQFFLNVSGRTPMLGRTSYSVTEYGFFIPPKKKVFAEALSLFSSLLLEGALQYGLEAERSIILGEYRREMPTSALVSLLSRQNEMLYGTEHSRYKTHHILGTEASIGKMNLKMLNAYREAYYRPANISMVVVGNMSVDDTMNIIRDSSFTMDIGGSREKNSFSTVVPAPGEHLYKTQIDEYFPGNNSAKYESCALLPGTSDRQVVHSSVVLLSQKLFDVVREERALTYSISCHNHPGDEHFEFWVQCGTLSPGGVDHIQDLVSACIDEVLHDVDAFSQYHAQSMISLQMQELGSSDVCGIAMGQLSFRDYVKTLNAGMASMNSITHEDIRNMLLQVTQDNRWSLLLHP